MTFIGYIEIDLTMFEAHRVMLIFMNFIYSGAI